MSPSISPFPDRPLILVDELRAWPQAPKPGAEKLFGNGKESCHMTVDGRIDVLHAFARRMNLKRSWFQHDNDSGTLPHYDLNPGKRSQAIALGALSVPAEMMTKILRARIAAGHRDGCSCSSCTKVAAWGGGDAIQQAWDETVIVAQLACPHSSRHYLAGICKRAATAPWLATKKDALLHVAAQAELLHLRDNDAHPVATEHARARADRARLNEVLAAMPAPPSTDDLELIGMLIEAAAPMEIQHATAQRRARALMSVRRSDP